MKYVVKSGDTLSGIGYKLGVSWVSIANANGIKPPYIIRPGQSLEVPGSGGGGATLVGPQPYNGQQLASYNNTNNSASANNGTVSSGTALPPSLSDPLGMVINGVILYGLFRVVMKVF